MLYYNISLEKFYDGMYKFFFEKISDSTGDAGYHDSSKKLSEALRQNESDVILASFLRYIHIFLNVYYFILYNLKFIYSGPCLFEMITLKMFREKSKNINLNVHLFEAHHDCLEVL